METKEEIILAVSKNLKAFRNKKNLTLDHLAKISGVSRAMLVQIEQAKTNPSISTLCRIANALRISVPKILEVGESSKFRFVSGKESPILWSTNKGSEAKLLIGTNEPECVEFWKWTIAPGEFFGGDAHPKKTRELIYVEKGTLTISFDGQSFLIGKGNSFIFQADRAHQYENKEKHICIFSMVVIEPLYI